MLLCGEFNNAHLDTSFASIDPKTMKLHPIEGNYPRNLKTALNPIDYRPVYHAWSLWWISVMVMFLLLFTTTRDQDVKNQYQLSQLSSAKEICWLCD